MDAWTRETDIRGVLSPRSLLFHRVTQLMRTLPVRPPQPKRLSTSSAGAHASGYRELSGEESEGEWKDAGHSPNCSPPKERMHRCRCHNMPEVRKDGTTSEKGESSGFIEWHGPSLLLLVLLGTFMNMEYSILMPTVWEYLESMDASKLFLGFVVGSFSVARMLFFGPIGLWTDRRPMREVFIVTSVLGILGNALYGVAGRVGSPWVCVAARFITGIGATSAVTSRTYLTRVTTAKMRTTAMAAQNGIQFIGVLVGPALNFAFTKLDLRIGSYIEVNELTAAGYFMVLPSLVTLMGFALLFKEPPSPEPHGGEDKSLPQHKGTHRGPSRADRRRILCEDGGWFCLLTAFMTTFNLSALETAITPITKAHFNWGTMENSFLFSGLAVSALMAIIFTVIVSKRGRYDREIILYGVVCMLTSLIVSIVWCGDPQHLSLYATIGGGILLAFGLIAIANPNTSLYTKIVGDRHQGLFNSLQFFVIAAGRCLGPMAAGACLQHATHAHTYYPFYGGLLALTLLPTIALVVLWRTFGRVDADARATQQKKQRTAVSRVVEEVGVPVTAAAEVFGAELQDPLLVPVYSDDEEDVLDDGEMDGQYGVAGSGGAGSPGEGAKRDNGYAVLCFVKQQL